MAGYLEPLYAESMAEWGRPFELRHSGGWSILREIPGNGGQDAMGVYPLFCCPNWAGLQSDLEQLREMGLVTCALVTDPFGDYSVDALRSCFDTVIPFKRHFVADLSLPFNELVSKSHRKTARRASREVEVELCTEPLEWLDDWVDVYAVLTKRHNIPALRAFSREAFARQLQVSGTVLFRADHSGETVGLDWWYVQGDVAYGHLAAFSGKGYELEASYATKQHVLEYFAGKVAWVNFGGGPGISATEEDGLSRFKRGWSSQTKLTYFCGSILNHDRYRSAVEATGTQEQTYFPKYRAGELA